MAHTVASLPTPTPSQARGVPRRAAAANHARGAGGVRSSSTSMPSKMVWMSVRAVSPAPFWPIGQNLPPPRLCCRPHNSGSSLLSVGRLSPPAVMEPLMSFTNGRNFQGPPPANRLRDGVSGSPLIANREELPAMSRPPTQAAATMSRRTSPRIHPLMNPISGRNSWTGRLQHGLYPLRTARNPNSTPRPPTD